MPAAPETWLEEFIVNLTTSDSQGDPDVIQLANGNILVSWTSAEDTGAGAQPGNDIIGQLFDPMGNPVGGEYRLNLGFSADDEQDADMVALPGGGLVMVYEDTNVTGTSIRIHTFDASGAPVPGASFSVVTDNVAGTPDYANPRIAASSDTSVMVIYQSDQGAGFGIVGRVFNPETNTAGAEFPVMTGGGGYSSADITVLSNGNYAIVAQENSPDATIHYRILSPSGANVLGNMGIAGTVGDGFDDLDPSITALTGGGFVIAYTDNDATDTDVTLHVYDAAGVEIAGPINAGSGVNEDNEPVLAGLFDGSFVVVYDDDEADTLVASHYGAAGALLGSTSFASQGASPAITDLGDGRFTVVWASIAEIAMEILDTRDFVNPNAAYIPEPNWQVGTIGNDSFTTDADADIVHGHLGDDYIAVAGASNGVNEYHGDEGDDYLEIDYIDDNPDFYDGGADNDTLSVNNQDVDGIVINLETGVLDIGGDAGVVQNFENIDGSNQDDTFTGDGGANQLKGFGGDDTLDGGLGSDIMFGGVGDDVYFIDVSTDQANEFADEGTDTVRTAGNHVLQGNVENAILFNSANRNLTGNELDNSLVGNSGKNVLDGLAGNDTLRGKAGDDTYYVDSSSDVVTELGGEGTDRVYSSANFVMNGSIENAFLLGSSNRNLTGNAGNNTLGGNDGKNVLDGGVGTDTMAGGAGDDTYYVDQSADGVTELGAEGTDRVYSSANFVMNGSIENAFLTGSENKNLTGNAGNNTLGGNAGKNVLDGGDGADTMDGGGGDDTYYIDSSGDMVIEAPNQGTDRVFTTTTYILGSDVENATLTGALSRHLTGNGGANVLTGNTGNNILIGGGAADRLTGGAGNDRFKFNDVSDSTFADYDRIFDLEVGDLIDLAVIDANINLGGNQGFTLVAAFTGVASQMTLIYSAGTDTTTLAMDVNGDGVADMRVLLYGDQSGHANFLL